jgi:hypothetical protein
MKDQHDGDCTIYSCLHNGSPENGICTCGYGYQRVREGDWSEMYSKELKQVMQDKESGLAKLLGERREGKF